VEEHSRRGRKTLAAGHRPALWWGRLAPPGGIVPPHPPLLRVSSRRFLSLPVMSLVADKFHVYFALESLFSAFLK